MYISLERRKKLKYAVMIEPFDGFEYVKDGCGAMWTVGTPVKVFDTKEEAQVEADKWNTGEVVKYELLE